MAEKLPEIQGKTPDSKEEVWIAHVLYEEGISFVFQFSIGGGSDQRLGRIVDFLLFPSQPNEIPMEFYGDYWHKDELTGDDNTRLRQIAGYFGVEPLILWGSDAGSPQEIRQWVRAEVMY